MTSSVDQIFQNKNSARLKIYAYRILDDAHQSQLKIGQTSQDVKTRVAQQLKTAAIQNFEIVVDEFAEREDGTTFSDHDVRSRLRAKGFESTQLEWMRCEPSDVRTAIAELKLNKALSGSHHLSFGLRREQAEAVLKTHEYFHSVWKEDIHAKPRFLWNAKMRFGKTFAAYQLAKKLPAKRILVVTFKPAVEDSWRIDLESHVDFEGWQFSSKSMNSDPLKADPKKPLVYFGSFQDLLGKDDLGRIKPRNEWLHQVKWDLVVFDEYHFGAWRDTAKELFEGEDESEQKKESNLVYNPVLDDFHQEIGDLNADELDFLPISARAYLYLSGTPFRALATGEFIEEQIYNWSYSDEQKAKSDFNLNHPEKWNPYQSLPQMNLLTYQMPDELIAIASQGEFNEFDLNTFFAASGLGKNARFKDEDAVNKWLQIIRGEYAPTQVDQLKLGSQKPPFPYADVRLLPHLEHSFWFLPTVASCHAMANLLAERHNKFWHDYDVVVAAGKQAGIGLEALKPVRTAIASGFETKSITLSCGKLTTGVTVPQWSSILMLRNLKSPETYFQAAFRVQSSWTVRNPNGDDPNEEAVIKPVCYVFDFAPTRALRQISEYAIGLSPVDENPEKAVDDLIAYLPVLAYDGAHMVQIDAGAILDTAIAGTSATLLARKWESALLVNVDNATLSQVLKDPKAMEAILKIEGFRKLGDKVLETIIAKGDSVKAKRKEVGDRDPVAKKIISEEEKSYKALRKQVQEKLIKFATRIPAFMYLTDFRENKLQDVITKIDSELFRTVTGLTVEDFDLLVSLNVFNASHMNQAVYAFRRYEDSSLSYAGVNAHEGLKQYGLFDTVIAVE